MYYHTAAELRSHLEQVANKNIALVCSRLTCIEAVQQNATSWLMRAKDCSAVAPMCFDPQKIPLVLTCNVRFIYAQKFNLSFSAFFHSPLIIPACFADLDRITHSNFSGTLKNPGAIFSVTSITFPSLPSFLLRVKPHSTRAMLMKSDRSATCTPGHTRLPAP
jgi:hypothetical protein